MARRAHARQAVSRAAAQRGVQAQQALRLRAAGATYRAIAEQLDVAVGKAHELVVEALEEQHLHVRREARHFLTLANRRLDDALRAAYSAMTPRQEIARGAGPEGTDLVVSVTPEPRQQIRAADAIRRIEMDRARLLGILPAEEHLHRWLGDDPEGLDERSAQIRSELMGMPADELDRQLAAFQLGREAEATHRQRQSKQQRAQAALPAGRR